MSFKSAATWSRCCCVVARRVPRARLHGVAVAEPEHRTRRGEAHDARTQLRQRAAAAGQARRQRRQGCVRRQVTSLHKVNVLNSCKMTLYKILKHIKSLLRLRSECTSMSDVNGAYRKMDSILFLTGTRCLGNKRHKRV